MAALAATRNLISIDEARSLVLERVERLPAETLRPRGRPRARARRGRGCGRRPAAVRQLGDGRLRVALGRHARDGCPSFTESRPGAPAPRSLEAGEAMGIATGGVVPEGADAVIPFEYVVEHDNAIEIEHARRAGCERSPGGGRHRRRRDRSSTRAHVWRRATSARSPRRASPEVRVARRPRAAVVVTGSELRPPGEALAAGTDLRGERDPARGAAGLGRRRGRAGERRSRTRRRPIARLSSAGSSADVLVTSGGVSVGPARPRSGDPGRARRRGGVLGRLGEAGQADLVRRRSETGSSSACPGTRSRCSSASSSSSGRLCWRFRAAPIPARGSSAACSARS